MRTMTKLASMKPSPNTASNSTMVRMNELISAAMSPRLPVARKE